MRVSEIMNSLATRDLYKQLIQLGDGLSKLQLDQSMTKVR